MSRTSSVVVDQSLATLRGPSEPQGKEERIFPGDIVPYSRPAKWRRMSEVDWKRRYHKCTILAMLISLPFAVAVWEPASPVITGRTIGFVVYSN